MTRSQVSSKDFAVALYKRAGLTTFPCRKDKRPINPGWQTNDYDAVDLGKIYGVPMTAEMFTLDVDTRRYDETSNEMQYKDLLARFKMPFPVPTFTVKTGGGAHIYLSCPPGRRYKMYVPETNKAIEIKSLGRYVIGAGSIHPVTKAPYEIIRGSLDDLYEAPEALLRFCESVGPVLSEENEDDSQENQDRFIRYCLQTQPAIEGDGGNNQTYNTACKASDFGLSESLCFDIMWEYYNNRCYPKWDKSELEEVITHAYAYAQNTRGSNSLTIDLDEFSEDDYADNFETESGGVVNGNSKIGNTASRNVADAIKNGKRFRLEYGQFGWDWYTNREGVQTNPKPTLKNLINYLINDHAEKEGQRNPLKNLVGFNELAHRIEFTRTAPWRDYEVKTFGKNDYVQLKYYMSTRRDLIFPSETIEEGVIIAAMDNRFNPLMEHLDSLKWDGKERLDTWLIDYLGAEDDPVGYTRAVGRITLLSAVARAYDPGSKVDTMTVFEGPQGQGKGTIVEILGGDFATSMQIHLTNYDDHKKTIMRMLGKWIIEIPEMTFTRKNEIEAIKAFLTTRVDNIVLPWGKAAEDIKRSSIFIGTFNPTADGAYLNDTTGNRRYLPVRTGKYKLEAIRKVRDQLFAEAIVRYKNGEKWHMEDPELIKMAEEEQASRTVREVWTERIQEWLEEYEGDHHRFTMLDMGRVVLGHSGKIDARATRRIGAAMRELGYVYKSVKENNKVTRYWLKEKKLKRKKE